MARALRSRDIRRLAEASVEAGVKTPYMVDVTKSQALGLAQEFDALEELDLSTSYEDQAVEVMNGASIFGVKINVIGA